MDEIRSGVVRRLMQIMCDERVSLETRAKTAHEYPSTDAERRVAAITLASIAAENLHYVQTVLTHNSMPASRTPTADSRSLLDITFTELRAEVRKGVALAFVLDRLQPIWDSRPDTPLVNVLKPLPPTQIRELIEALKFGGVHDLDELE